MKGWVYVISNKAMPGLVKVGYSMKDPALRAQELDHTGSPHPYSVDYELLVEEPFSIEQKVHSHLKNHREGKEWFRCTAEQAVVAIKQVAGDKQILENFKLADRQKTEELQRKEEELRKEKEVKELQEEQNRRDQALVKEKEQEIINKHDKAIKGAYENDLSTAYNDRGTEFENNGLHDRAIEDFNKAIDLSPNLAEAYNNRGNAYYAKDQYEKAIVDYNKAIDFNPNLVEAYYDRGNAYYEAGQYNRAIKDFNRACNLGHKPACEFLRIMQNRHPSVFRLAQTETARTMCSRCGFRYSVTMGRYEDYSSCPNCHHYHKVNINW